MKIGIIGAGNVGKAVGRRLAAAGHEIRVAFGRTPEAVSAAAAAIGHGARAVALTEAVEASDVVFIATPWAATGDLLMQIGPQVGQRIVWDTSNPMKPDMSGLTLGLTTSAGEEIARWLPQARVVKAIVPFAEVLASPSTEIGGQRPGVFVCGDDAEARATVAELVAQIGADPVDAGPLALARYTEPLGMLLVQLAYVQGFGARIGSALLR